MRKKFISVFTPNKEVLIYYFCNSLKPSIWAQTNKHSRDLNICKKAIKKTINVEAKAAY